METYIQVAGQGQLVETVVEQRATLTITVKASKTEVALAEAGSLRNDAIRALKNAGLRPDEISEGGREAWQPWYRKRSTGQEVSQRVLVACRETRRLYQALDALQPLFENARYTLNVDMQQPRFEAPEGGEATARAAAIQQARTNALALAQEAGGRWAPWRRSRSWDRRQRVRARMVTTHGQQQAAPSHWDQRLPTASKSWPAPRACGRCATVFAF